MKAVLTLAQLGNIIPTDHDLDHREGRYIPDLHDLYDLAHAAGRDLT